MRESDVEILFYRAYAQGSYQLICTIRTNDNELTVQCNTSPAVSRTPLNRYCQ